MVAVVFVNLHHSRKGEKTEHLLKSSSHGPGLVGKNLKNWPCPCGLGFGILTFHHDPQRPKTLIIFLALGCWPWPLFVWRMYARLHDKTGF